MNKMQLPQRKLLYAVSELYRLRRVDETEKRQLKGTPVPSQRRSSQTTWRSSSCWSRSSRSRT